MKCATSRNKILISKSVRLKLFKGKEEIKAGVIDIQKKKTIEYRGEVLPKNFYRTQELNQQEKRIAKAQGFEYVRVNDLDGHQRGGYYIKKENPQETVTHFVQKHLFTELHDNIYVEQVFGDRRVDVVFMLEGFKLGIEIETGANREDYLADKIKWLDKHFDSWIFVCPSKLVEKYMKYVDNKKSYCATPKEAKKLVLEFIPPEELRNDFGEIA